MADIVQLQNDNNEDIFPVTNTKAVYDDAGNRLDNVISNKLTRNRTAEVSSLLANDTISKGMVSQDTWGNSHLTIKDGSGQRLSYIQPLYRADGNFDINFNTEGGRLCTDFKPIATQNLTSDAYNLSKTYAQGEYCISNNQLWKSKVNNNTGNTPAEGSYWTATNIVNSLNALSAKFYTLYNVSDLDSVNENCIISAYGKSELGGEWALILNMVLVDSYGGYNTAFKAQIAVNLQLGTLYKRGKYNGVWTSWKSLG